MKDAEVKIDRALSRKPLDFLDKDSKTASKIFDVPVPVITKESNVISLGSCFAYHVRTALSNYGIKANNLVFYDDQITTTLAMREHFEWLTSEEELTTQIICDRTGRSTLGNFANVEKRFSDYKRDSVEAMKNVDCVILTYGLSEAHLDKNTNRSVWKWPGKSSDRIEDLYLHLLTSTENCENVRETVSMIRKMNANTSVVMSLSPVSLHGTFRNDYKIVIANSASKSRIRSGLDEYFSSNTDKNVFYWPSYEYVMSHKDPWDQDQRHVKDSVVKEIMDEFVTRTGCKKCK